MNAWRRGILQHWLLDQHKFGVMPRGEQALHLKVSTGKQTRLHKNGYGAEKTDNVLAEKAPVPLLGGSSDSPLRLLPPTMQSLKGCKS